MPSNKILAAGDPESAEPRTDPLPKNGDSVVTEFDALPPSKPHSSWWRKIVGLIWDSVEGDPRNRKYVQKLDNFLL
jgi:hypothetical protein